MTFNSNYVVSITGKRNHLPSARELVHLVSRRAGLETMEADIMELAVSEACENALDHGRSKGSTDQFKLELSINEKSITATISNKGAKIDFDHIEPFNTHQDFRVYEKGGLGLPLIKSLMDEVRYEYTSDNKNILTLIKHIKHTIKRRN